MWRSKKSNQFERSYKRLSNELVDRVDNAIDTLTAVERPDLLGIPKGGGYYVWEFGRSCRLLYKPDFDDVIIYFPRVCSHKKVYP